MAPDAQELRNIYNLIAGEVRNEQTIRIETGIAQAGATYYVNVSIDSTIYEATFSVTWSNSASDINLILKMPDGTIIDPTAAASNPLIEYVAGLTYEYYRIKSPILMMGTWIMEIIGGTISPSSKGVIATSGGEPYTAMVTGRSGLLLRSYLDRDTYLTTMDIKVIAALFDHAPITGATVKVDIQMPSPGASQIRALDWIEVNGDTMPDPASIAELKKMAVSASYTMILYDDGAHGDGEANDGVYANTLYGSSTQEVGTYVFEVTASGTSNLGEAFTRRSENSVYVAQHPEPRQFVYLPIVFKSH
jgi:hypothetical protein